MGLSQQIGASSLIKPGVIDNSTQRPASPYEGQVIFQKDTDQLLVWNGTAWVIPNAPAQNPTGLEYITGGALSGTSTNFAGCFTTTYDNYKILIDDVSPSASISLVFQFLVGTTPNQTADYNWAFRGLRTDAVNIDVNGQAQTFGFTGITGGVGADSIGFASLDVFGPKLTTNRTIIIANAYSYPQEWGARNGGSHFNSFNSFDGIRFFTNSAATVTGTVRIYGYRNS